MIVFRIQIISTLCKSAVSISCKAVIIPVANPDLQIRGVAGGGCGGGGGGLKKIFFSALRASFWPKNKGEPGSPGPLPWSRHCIPHNQLNIF